MNILNSFTQQISAALDQELIQDLLDLEYSYDEALKIVTEYNNEDFWNPSVDSF